GWANRATQVADPRPVSAHSDRLSRRPQRTPRLPALPAQIAAPRVRRPVCRVAASSTSAFSSVGANSTGWTPAAPRVGRKLWCRCPHAQSRPSVFPTMPVPVHGSSTFAVLLFSCGTDTMPERGAVNNDGGDVPLTFRAVVAPNCYRTATPVDDLLKRTNHPFRG